MNHFKKQAVASVLCFLSIPLTLLGATMLLPKQTVSTIERRKLTSFPNLSWNGLVDQSFQDQADRALSDHLFARKSLLQLRSLVDTVLLGRLDDEGLISREGILIETGQSVSSESIAHAASVFDRIWQTCLKDSHCKVYLGIIPDKAYFLRDDPDVLTMDYDAFFEDAASLLPAAQQIDLASSLNLHSYYASDPHWKQQTLLQPARLLADSMGVSIPDGWSQKDAGPFAGSQGAVSTLDRAEDRLKYLDRPGLEKWTITRYDEHGSSAAGAYDFSKIDSPDPYAFFLGGAAGMITIDNPDSSSQRQLVLFGDSYSWSMGLLLASAYEKTTIIDLRNIPSFRIPSLVDFSDQDVLFLYSMSILNDSSALR